MMRQEDINYFPQQTSLSSSPQKKPQAKPKKQTKAEREAQEDLEYRLERSAIEQRKRDRAAGII